MIGANSDYFRELNQFRLSTSATAESRESILLSSKLKTGAAQSWPLVRPDSLRRKLGDNRVAGEKVASMELLLIKNNLGKQLQYYLDTHLASPTVPTTPSISIPTCVQMALKYKGERKREKGTKGKR
jgi:hypothetical protein